MKSYFFLIIALFTALAFASEASVTPFSLEGRWQLKSERCGLKSEQNIHFFKALEATFKDDFFFLSGRADGCEYSASGKFRLHQNELLWLAEDSRSCQGIAVANSEVRKVQILNFNEITILGRSYFNEPCENGVIIGTWVRL